MTHQDAQRELVHLHPDYPVVRRQQLEVDRLKREPQRAVDGEHERDLLLEFPADVVEGAALEGDQGGGEDGEVDGGDGDVGQALLRDGSALKG